MAEIVLDHAALENLDAASDWAQWRGVLERTGVPDGGLGEPWPAALRTLAWEMATPEGLDRWLVARVVVALAAVASLFGSVLGFLAVVAPWAEPAGVADTVGYERGVAVGFFGGVSERGGYAIVAWFGVQSAIFLVAERVLHRMRPAHASSQKTIVIAGAVRWLRENDFVGRVGNTRVENLPSAQWLTRVAASCDRMLLGLDHVRGDGLGELAAALAELVGVVGEARGALEAQLAEPLDGVREVRIDLAPVIAAIGRVDALADRIEPFRRWLVRFPPR